MARKDRREYLFQLLDEFEADGVTRINYLEVGTYDGRRAADLCRHWQKGTGKQFNYVGFDLFEDMTKEMSTKELSKSKLPPARSEVDKILRKAGATPSLIKGNTRDTIPAFVETMLGKYTPHIIFIDGGHSLDTIASDWTALKFLMGPNTVVVFDDYYENREDFGCKSLITTLQKESGYIVGVLDPVEYIPHNDLAIRFATVRLKG